MRNMNREQKLAVLAYIVDTLQNDENEDKNEDSEVIKIAFRRKQILFKNAFYRKQFLFKNAFCRKQIFINFAFCKKHKF